MGLRSRMRSIGIRLLESLVGNHSSHREHHLSCRVCAAEQAIRADDQSICASHLLTHLDSLAPSIQAASLPPTTTASPAPTQSTVSPTSTNTTHKIRRKSLPRRQTTNVALAPTPRRSTCPCAGAELDACSRGTCGCQYKCDCDCNCIENQTMHFKRLESEYYAKLRRDPFPACLGPDQTRRLVEPNGLVQSLQTALGSLRYAISGHLGVQLQASRTDKGSRFFRAAFTNNEDISKVTLAMSEASRPTIVCPRSTLDVFPSWAAASRGQYTFGPDQVRDGDHPTPSSLRINVDGTLTKVHIDWVEDEQFNCAPFIVEDLTTSCPSSTVPVLSLSSIINQAAALLGTSTDASSLYQRILTNHVTICLKIKQQQGLAIPTAEAPALYRYEFFDSFCTNSFRKCLYDHFYNEPPQERAIRHKPVPTSSIDKALPPIPILR
ncbi:hypothetical protein F503_07273 [Ophiostoma piceae UAMH 11346]|uniref:Uncharacterized protein n=1 Tax=Ophiostoma piceae (strain UAMH 11346) TaxID=1262450 RepID=S3C9G9_OPHP1|nr:hypothetical protein F503_07273 [Ophiostoma piceae UAMH 11346]